MDDPVRQAIDGYFGGDTALYEAYLGMCRVQFAQDLIDGDNACAKLDRQALRRVAHNLKSVLLTLGHPQGCQTARSLEDQAMAGSDAVVSQGWRELRQVLEGIAKA